VKKLSPSALIALVLFNLIVISCTKVNEATELGGDLIPEVDNINTFDSTFETVTDNRRFIDTTRIVNSSDLVIGHLDDPEFGKVDAGFHFNVLPTQFGKYPFVHKDSVIVMDSVVLSLAYNGSYGDTANGSQTLRVFEIDPAADFKFDSNYKYTSPTSDFATIGPELGSKTFTIRSLKDSVWVVRPKDTAKVGGVVRIRLNNDLATRFASYDTSAGPLGAYRYDTAGSKPLGNTFRSLFKGMAIKADNGGNVLSYFNVADINRTKLTVYFKVIHSNGKNDTLSFDFKHTTNGQANYVQYTPAGGWASGLAGGTSDQTLYIQSGPSGSYASVYIPGLSNLENKVIHRADLFVNRIATTTDATFKEPDLLFLDRVNRTGDTVSTLHYDLAFGGGAYDVTFFGGRLSNGMYRFNMTRFVQGIVTRKEPNDTLRLHAPIRSSAFDKLANSYQTFSINPKPAFGRVVVGGGSHPDPALRMRLRIIYSNR